jgi:hypothetical protein
LITLFWFNKRRNKKRPKAGKKKRPKALEEEINSV